MAKDKFHEDIILRLNKLISSPEENVIITSAEILYVIECMEMIPRLIDSQQESNNELRKALKLIQDLQTKVTMQQSAAFKIITPTILH